MDHHVWLAESAAEQHPLRLPATLAIADNVAATGKSRPIPDIPAIHADDPSTLKPATRRLRLG
jgi:hypothetical protein